MAKIHGSILCALLVLLVACEQNREQESNLGVTGAEKFHCEGKMGTRLVMHNFGFNEKGGVAWIDEGTQVPAKFGRETVEFKVDRHGASEWYYEFNRATERLKFWFVGIPPLDMDCTRVN